MAENSEIVCRPQFARREYPSAEDPFCFVIMPFRVPLLEEVYRGYVKPTIESAGIKCVRGDDVFTTNAIIEDIWVSLCRCAFVVGEFTGRNPNVLYEAGIAHTLGKPLIGMTQDIQDVPFDFRHRRVIDYRNSPTGYTELVDRLRSTVNQLMQTAVDASPRPVDDKAELIQGLVSALHDERTRTADLYYAIERRHLWQTRYFHQELRPLLGAADDIGLPAVCRVESTSVEVDEWDSNDGAVAYGQLETVSDFDIGVYPVTNSEYAEFVRRSGHYPPENWKSSSPPRVLADSPVVGVSWTDVMLYCEWLTAAFGRTVRLPSEAEWLAAAGYRRGEQIYPWGSTWLGDACNSSESAIRGVSSTRRFDGFRSPPGAADLLGNVWEWTSSEYQSDGSFPWRAVRGGANYTDLKGVGLLARLLAFPGHFLFVRDLGFRIVVEIDGHGELAE